MFGMHSTELSACYSVQNLLCMGELQVLRGAGLIEGEYLFEPFGKCCGEKRWAVSVFRHTQHFLESWESCGLVQLCACYDGESTCQFRANTGPYMCGVMLHVNCTQLIPKVAFHAVRLEGKLLIPPVTNRWLEPTDYRCGG